MSITQQSKDRKAHLRELAAFVEEDQAAVRDQRRLATTRPVLETNPSERTCEESSS